MSAIQNLAEPWAGHTFKEIEDFVNAQLEEIDEILDIYEYQKSREWHLTIETIEEGTTLSWLLPTSGRESHACTIEYSTDNGETWHSVTSAYDDSGNIDTDIPAGTKFIFRGNGPTGFPYDESGRAGGSFFNASDPCYVYGNVMSLLYGDNFYDRLEIEDIYALAYLFCGTSSASSGSWVHFKENMPVVLPATTLSAGCYSYMFYGCTSLTAAPELPATTLDTYCYEGMFYGCRSLTAAPELPATTLASDCYYSMFRGCTSLTSAPELPATTLANNCYFYMFIGCSALTAAPELPATTLAKNCYRGMFAYCTSLTEAPELPATTLAGSCYQQMFQGCTSLTSVKCLASAVSPSNAVNNWLYNVSATGTFTKAAGVSWPSGSSGIPSGWTVQTASE